MFVTAIAGIPHQNRQLAFTHRVIRHGVQRRIHAGGEIEQLAAHVRVLFSKIVEIAAGSKNATYAPLSHAAQGIKKTEFPAAGDFIKIGSPDMPAALGGFNPSAEKRQPQAGIELPVEKETLLTIRFGFGNHRLRQ